VLEQKQLLLDMGDTAGVSGCVWRQGWGSHWQCHASATQHFCKCVPPILGLFRDEDASLRVMAATQLAINQLPLAVLCSRRLCWTTPGSGLKKSWSMDPLKDWRPTVYTVSAGGHSMHVTEYKTARQAYCSCKT
jgi:hypothetical protein